MVVKMTSKGQLVIPKKIRQALDLKPGTEFEVELNKGHIVLKPVLDKEKAIKAVNALHGMFAGSNILEDLEAEHRWEIERDLRREQSLRF